MDKEFPGYFDSDHHLHHNPAQPTLDVHDKRNDLLQDISSRMDSGPAMTCEKVTKLLEGHHSIDECVTIEIDVYGNGTKPIPVAFVTKRLGSEGHDEEGLYGKLINATHQVLNDNNYNRHQELEHDLMIKLHEFFDQPDIKDDLIRDDLINLIHDEFETSKDIKIVIVPDIPRTICGRILKGTMMKIARGESYEINPMIESRETLKQVEQEIHKLQQRQKEHIDRN